MDKEKAIEVLDLFISSSPKVKYSGKELEYKEFDIERMNISPQIKKLINDFIQGKIELEDFKISNDSINKKYHLWGFAGTTGQMFFNQIYNNSTDHNRLKDILIRLLNEPTDIMGAKLKIYELLEYVNELKNIIEDKRQAPKPKSVLLFLSYFWHIQNPKKYPIYFKSMEDAFEELGILNKVDDLGILYEEYYKLNHEIKDIFESHLNEESDLWAVEHVFHWYITNYLKRESELMEDGDIKYSNPHEISALLESKKQIILYGPPGTGKTFNTKKYAVEFLEGELND